MKSLDNLNNYINARDNVLTKDVDGYNAFTENTILGNTLVVVNNNEESFTQEKLKRIKTLVIAGEATGIPSYCYHATNITKLILDAPNMGGLNLNSKPYTLKEIEFGANCNPYIYFDREKIFSNLYEMINISLKEESLLKLVRRCPEIALQVGYGRFTMSFEPQLREAFLDGLLKKYHDGNITESAVDEMMKEYQGRCFQLYSEGLTEEERIKIKCEFLYNECGKISEKKNAILSQRKSSNIESKEVKEETKDYLSPSRSKIFMAKAKQEKIERLK